MRAIFKYDATIRDLPGNVSANAKGGEDFATFLSVRNVRIIVQNYAGLHTSGAVLFLQRFIGLGAHGLGALRVVGGNPVVEGNQVLDLMTLDITGNALHLDCFRGKTAFGVGADTCFPGGVIGSYRLRDKSHVHELPSLVNR